MSADAWIFSTAQEEEEREASNDIFSLMTKT